MSPYIVTTTLPTERRFADGSLVSRRAVATLEEARDAALREPWEDHQITEHGGSVSLPDGTVIEVEPVSLDSIRPDPATHTVRARSTAEIIAAFNAAQGGPR